MRLQEEAQAVVRETVLDAPAEAAWEHVRDLAWLEDDAEVVEEEAPRRLTLRWVPDRGTVVDVVLDEVDEGTLVTVVEVPLRTLRAVSDTAVEGVARGPMALAAQMSDVFHALADPTRREVVRLLSERGEMSASALAREMGVDGRRISRQAVAKHLAVLREAGLADVERAGREARYRFEPAPLGDAIAWMTDAGARWDRRLARLQRTLPR